MPHDALQIALISGPMYDSLYDALPEFTLATGIKFEVAFRGPHSELNAHLAALTGIRYDLISTHTKYAPSQAGILADIDAIEVGDFFPTVLDMAKIGGKLYGLPRNMDAKLLHYRRDVLTAVPKNWDDLYAIARELTRSGFYGFAFTGMGSGLFGVFYELAEMGGAAVFPDDDLPSLNNEGGAWALRLLRDLYQTETVPAAIVNWGFDDVHNFFRNGHAAMICDWPGYYASYRAEDSAVRGNIGLSRMPAGPLGFHKAYAGAHTFALTKRGMQDPRAHQLLSFLTSPEQQLTEARHGSVPVRQSVMDAMRQEGSERLELLEQVIRTDTLIPPRISYYPQIEEILCRTVQAAMIGETEIGAALRQMEIRISECHRQNKAPALTHAT
jgi:multiple sugar transport system substrate-binding protein